MSKLITVCVLIGSIIVAVLYTRKSDEYEVKELNTSYDYIIVGSGSAGSVLAARLSEDPNITVLILEAGSLQDNNPLISTPAAVTLLQHTEHDWDYYTVPQETSHFGFDENKSFWPRGRVVGGTSILNYLVYIRGSRHDYDSWAANGCDGWSYQEVLPYFLKSEDILAPHLMDSEYHRQGGPLKVSEARVTPLVDVFLKAGQELGEDIIDCNGKNQYGFCTMQATKTENGVRCSTYDAFLKSALQRSNLHLSDKSLATKVLLKDRKAVGVQFIKNGRKIITRAEKEVIVSAGAVETPHLLMLSGIGPKKHLQEMGIPVIQNLPVGENLQDHMMLILNSCINGTESMSVEEAMSFKNQVKYVLFGTGSLTLAGVLEGNAFLHSDPKKKFETFPDIQLHLVSISPKPRSKSHMGVREEVEKSVFDCPNNGFIVLVVLLHEKSRGTIRLQSKDPFDDPLIDPRYLEHPDDIKTYIKGIRFYQQLIKTEAFQRIGASKQKALPVCSDHIFDSDQYWECFVKNMAATLYHPTSTAKMGSTMDSTSVVDPYLRVKGVTGLRVVDASVMPEGVAGNTNAPTIMIAERAADLILGKDPLPKIKL